ncbi:unnamed protein product [Anisakis simplex]|uniref:Uncharacterized protein n=1 Tax=Anisakis simplex TaxID=6269 RepID=A0A0M3JN03_ANISI|nr:unnamed protein product [Anisakis simplex]
MLIDSRGLVNVFVVNHSRLVVVGRVLIKRLRSAN